MHRDKNSRIFRKQRDQRENDPAILNVISNPDCNSPLTKTGRNGSVSIFAEETQPRAVVRRFFNRRKGRKRLAMPAARS